MPLQTKTRVAFDTNMLLAIGQFKVDVFFEARKMFGGKAEFVMPGQVLAELEGMKGKDAGIAMKQAESQGLKVLEVEAGNADEALAGLAEQGFFVASNDAVLRKRIKGFGGKVIYLRQKRFLKMD